MTKIKKEKIKPERKDRFFLVNLFFLIWCCYGNKDISTNNW